MQKTTETFQTEVNELLHLIIHSLYSHPEIFLRELISNASDALDKLKIEALTQSNLLPAGYEPCIRISANKESRTLTVSDNGIGMTAEEIRENLGRIAHSGTKAFVKAAEQKPDLIGQFGVGFYSAFIVADKVTVESQRAGNTEGIRWESDGKGSYTLEPTTRTEGVGTTITLELKTTEGQEGDIKDFSEEWTIRDTVKRHSDFISYPIKMLISRSNPETKETTQEDVVLNSQKALWMKSASEVTAEEYKEFYQHLTHDYAEPLKTIHYRAEGTSEFSALIFIPPTRPWNFDYEGTHRGLSLYVKRVLIMSDCEDLLPAYLRFAKGVVDSSDLSLNVSREILQQDRQIVQIRKALTSKVIKSLADMQKDERSSYEKFWQSFGPILKEGIARESDRAEALLPTFLFNSTTSTELCTLSEYVSRMKPGQTEIYYATGKSLEILKASPLLERLKQKDYEVLLLDHPIDELIAPNFTQFENFKFQSIAAPELNLDSEDEKKERDDKLKSQREQLSTLIDVVKETLSEDIKDVQLSSRLTESPVCLVSEGESNPYLEQMYKQMGQAIPKQKRILEINPDHKIFERMNLLPKEEQKDWSELLYFQALISEGSKIENPAAFVQKINRLMLNSA
jgi:molecular chaperone HtpG